MTSTESPTRARSRASTGDPPVEHPRPRLGPHLALLVLLLGVLLALMPVDEPWNGDDGGYFHAVRLVRDEGRWYEERPELDLAEHPERYPLALSDIDEAGRAFPFVKHPAWVLVLVGSTTIFGDIWGMVLPGLVALAAAAGLSWHLGRRLGLRSPAVGFWLVAAGPLAFLTFGFWAHSVGAALGGVAALLLCRIVRRPSPASAALLGLVGAALVLVRSEGALFVVALVVALAVARAVHRGPGRGWFDPVLVAVIPAIAYVGEKAWIASLVEGELVSSGPGVPEAGSWLGGRLSGIWHTFGLAMGDRAAQGAIFLGVGLLVLAVVALSRGDRGTGPLFLVAAAAVVTLVPALADRVGLVTGVVPAWPVAVAGLVVGGLTRCWRSLEARILVALAAVFTALVVATQYPNGGGAEWGGRFLAPIAVPLAVLAAMGLASATGDDGAASDPASRPRDRRLLTTVVAVPALVLLVVGVVATGSRRDEATTVLAEVRATDPDVAVAHDGVFLPRYDIAGSSPRWVRADEEGLAAAAERAFTAGVDRVTVVGGGADEVRVPGTEVTVVHDSLVVLERAR